jgi:hypothetical protein
MALLQPPCRAELIIGRAVTRGRCFIVPIARLEQVLVQLPAAAAARSRSGSKAVTGRVNRICARFRKKKSFVGTKLFFLTLILIRVIRGGLLRLYRQSHFISELPYFIIGKNYSILFLEMTARIISKFFKTYRCFFGLDPLFSSVKNVTRKP